MNKTILNHISILRIILPFILLGLVGCSGDDDSASTNPKVRIVGNWKLVKEGDKDASSKMVYYTFKSDGKVTHQYRDENGKIIKSNGTYEFDEDWSYDESEDKIVGILYIIIDDMMVPYKFYLERNKMLWVPAFDKISIRDPRDYYERQ